MREKRSHFLFAVLALAGAMAFTACGNDDSSDGGDSGRR